MPKSLAFFRGNVVPIAQANVNVMTHALHYGTAVFEGVRGNWNDSAESMFIFRMKEHYLRLLQGCKMLMMDIPYNAEDLCEKVHAFLEQKEHNQDLAEKAKAFFENQKGAAKKLAGIVLETFN